MTDYDPNVLYQGTIISQTLTESKDRNPQLRVNVQLTGRLRSKLVSDGVDPLSEDLAVVKTVYFNFRPDTDHLKRIFGDLKQLGMTVADPSVFLPEHPKYLNLEGKEVCLKPRYAADNSGNQRDWWNLTFPMQKAPSIGKDALQTYKKLHVSALTHAFENAGKPSSKDSSKDERVPF